MKDQLHIAIPTACHEQWESFTPTGKGGYCSRCSKTVIDFTKMSDTEIVNYFIDNKENTCGKFRPAQLTTYDIQPGKNYSFPGWLPAFLVTAMLSLCSKQATSQMKTGEVSLQSEFNSVAMIPNSEKLLSDAMMVSGVVKDDSDGSVMPGVNVVLKGTEIKTSTDISGAFTFPEPLKPGDVLVFSFIGYQDQEHIISENQERINMRLEFSQMTLGKVAVVAGGIVVTRKISFRRWWWKFKGIFD